MKMETHPQVLNLAGISSSPSFQNVGWGLKRPHKYPPSTPQVPDKFKLLEYCRQQRGVKEMMSFLQLKDRKHFRENYLKELLKEKLIAMTDPASPQNPKQKYVTTPKGLKVLPKN